MRDEDVANKDCESKGLDFCGVKKAEQRLFPTPPPIRKTCIDRLQVPAALKASFLIFFF